MTAHQAIARHATHQATAKKKRSPAVAQQAVQAVRPQHPVSGTERDEMIRQAAYSFYAARHCVDGHALEDWLRAEAQVDGLPTPQALNTPAAP